MAHYQRAPGQPLCKFGCQCTRKKAEHWESYDHPADHPRMVNARKHSDPKQQDGPTLDRSKCALEGRDGEDPKTAVYTCAGCGTRVEGFGRWRNHMKRAKQSGSGSSTPTHGGGQAPGERASSATKVAKQNIAAHLEHQPAWAAADDPPNEAPVGAAGASSKQVAIKPLKAVGLVQKQPKASESRAEGKAVWRLSGKEKRAMAEAAAPAAATDAEGKAVWRLSGKEKRAMAEAAAPAAATDATAAEPTKPHSEPPQKATEVASASGGAPLGKRWLGLPGETGKRQRKFY